ncbi:GNAT family N-acetyltransferase [Neobacillus bataviensis]|uniref:GNAT family N-acetyltransferase n=1 Tax=Neobacillus bataviensis TaxID=220685 RepID=UPI001CBC8C2C|nr:GNAT family N-acetyltransferase [Neobacillus bataviensis]
MVEFRLLKSDEFDQAAALADQTFRDDEQISMGEAFPQVFSPALNQSYGAFINDKLVSFIGLVPSVIHLESAEIEAYSIGSVCTHRAYRKKGFASMLLEKVIDHVKRAKASILFVSGSLPLYIKAGCTFYGNLNKYDIHKDDLQIPEGYSVREFLPYDWFYLRKLYQTRKTYFEQSIFDFAVLNNAKGYASILKMEHKILVAEEENEIKGFVVLGVPDTSEGESTSRVIEWAGDPKGIQAVLAESFQYGFTSMRLSVPEYERELNRLLYSIEKTEAAFPGTIKITNLDLLLGQLKPYLFGKLEIVDADERNKKLLFNEKSIIVDNAALEKLILQGDPTLDSYLNDIFPVPLPFPEGINYV